jgi:hypothetical protein
MLVKTEQAANAKPVIRLLEAARDIIDRDVDLGLYEMDAVRLTVAARKKTVKQLADQGLSQRQIAKVVGANQATVSRDLGDANASKTDADASPKKARAARKRSKKTSSNGHPAIEKRNALADLPLSDGCADSFLNDEGDFAPVDQEADEACRIRGFLYRAEQSAFGAQAEKFENLACTEEMLAAAKEAVLAWTETCQTIEERLNLKTKDRDHKGSGLAATDVAVP